MHPHYAFIARTSCKESKNGATKIKTQLEFSTILVNNAVSVGNRILTFRGNVLSPFWIFRPLKTKTLCCLETLGSVYPVTASYLSWTDPSATPVRKLQNSHNVICRYSERMKVLHTIIFTSTWPHTLFPEKSSYYTLSWGRAHCHNSYQLRRNKSLWRNRPDGEISAPTPALLLRLFELKVPPLCAQDRPLVPILSQLKPMDNLTS
jgi:hypothetical protein